MKKSQILSLILALALLLGVAAPALAAPAVKIIVNGQNLKMDVPPSLESGTVLLPVRACAEALGSKVDYAAGGKIDIYLDDLVVNLVVGQKEVKQNGATATALVAPKIVDGRTLVPLRVIAEGLKAEITWDNTNKVVTIKRSGSGETPTPTPTPTPPTVPSQATRISADAQELLSYINNQRAKLGLNSLIVVAELTASAKRQNDDMYNNGFFSHASPSYGSPEQRAKAAGLPTFCENLALGQIKAKGVFDAWMASPMHRNNIIDAELRFIGLDILDLGNSTGSKQAVLQTVPGESFLIASRPSNVSGSFTVQGYSSKSQANLILYKMSDASTYVSRTDLTLDVDSNHYFKQTITLEKGCSYKLQCGNDSVDINS